MIFSFLQIIEIINNYVIEYKQKEVLDMIRFGILSTASIIDRYIVGIRASKHGYVQAIASRTVEKAKEAAERLNIETYYGTYEELYNDENVDVIYIPTVNGFHFRDAKNALMHHKHVVVEKPFVLKPEQAKELKLRKRIIVF